jgi:hypothetical protein
MTVNIDRNAARTPIRDESPKLITPKNEAFAIM